MFTSYKKIDSSGILDILDEFPRQCQNAFELGGSIAIPFSYKKIKNIVFSGMGGSAIGADLIRSYLIYRPVPPVFVIRHYRIPEFVDRTSLFFACSYSGNTEETIASFKAALKKKAKVIVISSGGRLLELARASKIPYVIVPKGYPPRQALGYFFFSPLKLLEQCGIVEKSDKKVTETISVLDNLRNNSLAMNVTGNNPAKKLANMLANRFPVIYGSTDYLDAVITRWRAQFAENSKTLSSVNLFPELNHNEIVGWRFPRRILKKFFIIILRDASEHKRISRRIEITKYLLIKDGFRVKEVWSEGKSLMARMFSLVYLGDFISYYLAILNKVDPAPVEPIAYLKKRLKDS